MEERKVKICVPVCVSRANELADAVKRAATFGDVIELRLDCLEGPQLSDAIKQYTQLRTEAGRPFVVTFRPAEHGGHRAFDTVERLSFWLGNSRFWVSNEWRFPDFADVEVELLASDYVRQQLSGHHVICSYHDFVGVPGNLSQIYERMVATSAPILKIAVQANDAPDCIPILDLLERARLDGRDLIAIAMGEAGVMTRILGPSFGSFMTYGSVDEDSTTAPGQLTARELRELYRIDSINKQTEIMGLIGWPVGHSVSPHIHNAAFASANVDAVFIPFEVHDIEAFIRRMVRERSREIEWNLRGLSVTAPHKTAVMKHLDWIEPAAKEIGAVNTIVIQDGVLHGHNTDVAGFIEPLKSQSGSLEGSRCAVIGAGGAARAVIYALRQEGAAIDLFVRRRERAETIENQFGVKRHLLAGAAFDRFDFVINTTPLGTRGQLQSETPATVEQLRGVRLAYDLVYNPLETRFMREACEAGCETIGGLEMLIGQAVEQFKLWTGKQPDVEAMRRAAEHALNT